MRQLRPSIIDSFFKSKWLLFVPLFLLLGAACSRVQLSPAPSSAATIVWPPAPEIPRISFVKTVQRPVDIGVRFSAMTRLGHSITGSEKGNEALVKPFALACDEHDNLCLTDTGANVVCFYDREKRKWRRYANIGRIRFASPVAVAKRNGIFFVADSALGKVIAFDQDGKLKFQATNHLERPSGLALLGARIFVADSQRHRVVVFDLEGGFEREFGERGTGPGQFNFPTHVATDNLGDIFVTDSLNNRVQVFDLAGSFKGEIGKIGDSPGQFGRPKGVAVDSFGHVYALDAVFDNLQIFDRNGRLLLHLGQAGNQPGEFWLPNGIAINGSNDIFVADSYNHRIQVFKYIGPS